RYLGKMANPLLPFYVDMSPLNKSQLYPNQDKLTQQQRARITTFRALMQQAVTPVFAQFQALGYQTLTYHSDNNQDVKLYKYRSDGLLHQGAKSGDSGPLLLCKLILVW